MKFSISRDALLEPLQLLIGVVDKRQTLPVLTNLLFEVEPDEVTLTSSDQEIELNARVEVENVSEPSELTLPARKLFEICRNLDAEAVLEIEASDETIQLQSGRFSSHLKGLPAHDFPRVDLQDNEFQQVIEGEAFRKLLAQVEFAMAQNDVRFFFNGVLLEFSSQGLCTVATNGQRLAKAELCCEGVAERQVIIPRKAISEIAKIARGDGMAWLGVNDRHFSIEKGNLRLTTQLIDAEFPDYRRAIPASREKCFQVDREELRHALVRIAIVSNEMYRNVRLQLSQGQLQLAANNPMHEEAEEVLPVDYEGLPLEIGFNVGYLIDALSTMNGQWVELAMSEASNPVVLSDPNDDLAVYVVSPMII